MATLQDDGYCVSSVFMKYALPIILITVFCLRIPSWFEPYWYGDEGITLTMGQAWRHGLVLYKELTDNKPPLLYLLAGLTYTLPWFKFLLTIWSLVTVMIFWQLTSLILKQQYQVLLATAIFAIITTLPHWEGNSVNGEIFQLLPVLAGITVILNSFQYLRVHSAGSEFEPNSTGAGSERQFTFKLPTSTRVRLFVAGCLFGLGFLFKHPVGFDLLAFLLLPLFLIKLTNLKQLRTTIYYWLYLIAGFLFLLLITSLWFVYLKAFMPFFNAVFSSNFTYVGVWEPLAHWGRTGDFGGTTIHRLLLAVGLTMILWLARNKLSVLITTICLWFIWNLFGTTLSGRPYAHYLLQAAPLLALFLTWGVTAKQIRVQVVSVIALAIFCLAWARIGYWSYPIVPYYQSFWLYASGQQTQTEFIEKFDPRVAEVYDVSHWVATYTQANDRIFLWGDDPQIFALADRLPATRYIAAYHIQQANAYDEVVSILKQQPPNIIIVTTDKVRPYPQLEEFLRQKYIELNFQDIDSRVYRYVGNLRSE